MIGEAGKHSHLSTLKGMVFAAGSGFWFLVGVKWLSRAHKAVCGTASSQPGPGLTPSRASQPSPPLCTVLLG